MNERTVPIQQNIEWLLNAEPWTRYRTMVDLLGREEDDPEVKQACDAMQADHRVQALKAATASWGTWPLKRHNDAGHPIYKFSTLADLGVRANDPEMAPAIAAVMAHQSAEGAFQTLVNIPSPFGGSGEDMWTWVLCDAPTLLYVLLAMGLGEEPRVQDAVAHITALADDVGWHCVAAEELGRFKGPGRKTDPCPMANVYALRALAEVPGLVDSPPARIGAEMLLSHWDDRGGRKLFLFGIGTDFHKLKYPFVWYDILNVVDVLSRHRFVHGDARFREMVAAVTDQSDSDGRFTAGSMYRAWKGWSFADKRQPSPWLTFLVYRILTRIEGCQTDQ